MSAYSSNASRTGIGTIHTSQIDATRRRQIFGPIQPMNQPSLFDRLFRRF